MECVCVAVRCAGVYARAIQHKGEWLSVYMSHEILIWVTSCVYESRVLLHIYKYINEYEYVYVYICVYACKLCKALQSTGLKRPR